MLDKFDNCPLCKDGKLQKTFVWVNDETIEATGCNKCHYSLWIPAKKDNSRWYGCAKCDAGYEDQECECKDHPPDCPWHNDWHSCSCGIF